MYVLIYSYGKKNRGLLKCFAAGVRAYGHRTGFLVGEQYKTYVHCDVLVTAGWNDTIAQIHRDSAAWSRPYIAISDGFLRRKGDENKRYFCVARNGIHAYGEHLDFNAADSHRFEELKIKPKPWREDGEHIVIAYQSLPLAVDGMLRVEWFSQALATLSRITRRPIVVRPHPKSTKEEIEEIPSDGVVVSKGKTFMEDLEDAWALVTYDSNAAVEAAVAGVPIFTGGRTMASPVSNFHLSDIEQPRMPDREQWLNWLAYTQWKVSEMELGIPWGTLLEEYVLRKVPTNPVTSLSWAASEAEKKKQRQLRRLEWQ